MRLLVFFPFFYVFSSAVSAADCVAEAQRYIEISQAAGKEEELARPALVALSDCAISSLGNSPAQEIVIPVNPGGENTLVPTSHESKDNDFLGR